MHHTFKLQSKVNAWLTAESRLIRQRSWLQDGSEPCSDLITEDSGENTSLPFHKEFQKVELTCH